MITRNHVLVFGPIVLFLGGIVIMFMNWIVGGALIGVAVVWILFGITDDIANFGAESLDRWRQDGKKYK